MDVAQIRAFLAVAEELHFRRAAERLHMSQPPLTRTIQALERELGTTLFDRSTRAVELTPSGAALIGPAREVLRALRRAEEATRSAARGETGRVRLAFAGVSSYELVAELARRVRSDRPGIELALASQTYAQPALRLLMSGDVDVALGRWDVIPAGLDSRVVERDGLIWALPATHRLAGDAEVPAAELADLRLISLPEHQGSVLVDRARRLAQAARVVPDFAQVAPDTQTALALVSAEVGAHLTLGSVARRVVDPHIRYVPPVEDEVAVMPDVHLRAAWRGREANPAVKTVLDLLSELTGEC
ncbi:LysR family transcriptional regulator [Dietzia sp. UBA5065]|uniref:LysR family transcriptional regulator n=1 Tax=Dietzia sp. UBA5065 TaxID=1946422 RepID=UPI0025B844C4|nr:LysR substrate-binding domain-containing protein [Dietzia sp. UBA5065]HMT51059.1 LysR substrate-binding domain-containing protein [Dietzia sp.]